MEPPSSRPAEHQAPARASTKRPTTPAAEEILGGYFPVLDHGFVALVDYMGSDEAVERAARVSYGYGTRQVSRTRGLLRYLRRHLHTTPSEMVEFKFHCAMPIFVARQWIRHRTASVNEYSGRYSLMPLLFYRPAETHFALQDATNKQGRAARQPPLPGFDQPGLTPGSELYQGAMDRWNAACERVCADYGWLVEEDVARELARIDLPLSTYTQWYWKIDLHNLLHFLTLRVDPHAQWEIQEYGRVIAGMVKRVAPLSYEAWIDYQVAGERLSRGEIEALSRLVRVEEDGDGVGVRRREDRRDADPGADEDNRIRLSDADLAGLGLSPREIREFKTKLQPRPVAEFALDLNTMRDAKEMEAKMTAAVPDVDRKR